MNSIKSEWPLLVFTVCAPLCAGAWVVAAFLALFDVFPQAIVLTTGWYGVLLCALLVVALGCSTLHLGKPMRALRAFARLGNSTVSNEVFTGALFTLSLIVYLLVAQSLVASSEIGKILLAFVAAFAMLFVLFQCLAYRMRTVSTWNSFSFSVEFAGIALLGGVCVESVLACLAVSVPLDVRVGLVSVGVACCVGMVLVVHAQGAVVVCSISGRRDVQVALTRWNAFSGARLFAMVVGVIMWACGMLSNEPMLLLSALGAAVVLAGIVMGRCAFYYYYVNVGLPRAQ